uniref:Uncharacterized protein n=1 Tax=Romanomermis culicivorax TaxID=13658 RepID=A0A915IR90_ROMCU
MDMADFRRRQLWNDRHPVYSLGTVLIFSVGAENFYESNPDPVGSVPQDPDPLNQIFQDPHPLSPKKSIRPIPKEQNYNQLPKG